MNDIKPRYQGRASFGEVGPQAQVPHHMDDQELVPIFTPDAGEVERVRALLPAREGATPTRPRDPIQDVARRLRREHLGGNRDGGYALIDAADLDLILAFVEERA